MDAPIQFEAATSADLPVIIALLAEDTLGATREDPTMPPNLAYVQTMQAIIADPNQLLAVARQNQQVVGCLQISFIPGLSRLGMWRGQIEGVRIASSQRGTGLGTTMLEWAIQQCQNRGCGLVQLTTDNSRTEAHRFYEKLGFKPTHQGFKLNLIK